MNKLLIGVAILLIAGMALGDDLSDLRMVLESGESQQKVVALSRLGGSRLMKSKNALAKLLYQTYTDETEEVAVRKAAVNGFFYIQAQTQPAEYRSILEDMRGDLEEDYKAETSYFNRWSAFWLLAYLEAGKPDPDVIDQSYPAPYDLIAAHRLVEKRQFEVAFPTLLRYLREDDDIWSLVAAELLLKMATLSKRDNNIDSLPKVEQAFPRLIGLLDTWRFSAQHLAKADEWKTAGIRLDPVDLLVGVLGRLNARVSPERRDVAVVETLAKVLKDDSLAEEIRRDAAYWLREGDSSQVLANIFAEAPDSSAGKIALRQIRIRPSLVKEIKKKPGPMVVRLIEIAENKGLPIQTRGQAVGMLPRMRNEARDALPALKKLSVRLPDLTRADITEKSYLEWQTHRRHQAFSDQARRTYDLIQERHPEEIDVQRNLENTQRTTAAEQ